MKKKIRTIDRPVSLADLANVGPATLGDFRTLGIRTLAQLAKQDAYRLYDRLCRATGARHDYVLSCASARVASGTASIESAGQKRVGMLAVKMGGKNMTFSQRIEAQRGALCTPP